MKFRILFASLLLLCGCEGLLGRSSSEPARTSTQGQQGQQGQQSQQGQQGTPPPGGASFDAGAFEVRVAWSEIRTDGSCWYFSGPERLGRDDHLGDRAHFKRDARATELAFGALRFTGPPASPIRLRRFSEHRSGGIWEVTETFEELPAEADSSPEQSPAEPGARPKLVAEPPSGILRLRYLYRECDTRARSSCPNHCTITATATLTPSGAP